MRSSMWSVSMVLAGVCAVTSVGCQSMSPNNGDASGGSDATGANDSGGALTACTVVTVAELNAATSRAFNPGQGQGLGDNTICGWDQVTDPNNEGGMNLSLYRSSGMSTYQSTADAVTGEEPVAGLGDEAFWHASGSLLMVRRGNTAFQITFNFSGGTQDMARQIATTVLGRI